MLQDLVRVDDIEPIIREVQGIDITNGEPTVRRGSIGEESGCPGNHRFCCVDTDHFTWFHPISEISRDGARSATDVKNRCPGEQVGDEVGRRILYGPPRMRPQD